MNWILLPNMNTQKKNLKSGEIMILNTTPLLMAMGPTEIEETVLHIGSKRLHYMRTEEYSALWKKLNYGLQFLFQTQQPVFTLASSGTGAMQMAIDNICSSDIKCAAFDAGHFGHRWLEIAKAQGISMLRYPLPEGTNATGDDVTALIAEHPEIKVIFSTYNETSTSALADIESMSHAFKGKDVLWVVDAVSALSVEPLNMDALGCDVVIASSQKGLALPPGLSFIAFSQKAWAFSAEIQCKSFYFDAKLYYKDWVRNQSPFTPAVGLLAQLEFRLDQFQTDGLEKYRNHYYTLTASLRKQLLALGVRFLSKAQANCTTAFDVPEGVDAAKVARRMLQEFNITIVPPYPGGKSLRIGNYGNLTQEDINLCCTCLALCFNR